MQKQNSKKKFLEKLYISLSFYFGDDDCDSLIKDYEEKLKDYMLVNSGCKNKDLRKTEFNSKVYFLTKEMRDKFEVEHTVSIIYIDKEKKRIAVKEVSADEKDNN